MGQAKLLGGVDPVLDHEGRGFGRVQDFEFFDLDLDFAARQLEVGLALRSFADYTGHPDDVLARELLALGHHLVFEDQLQETAAIAKIDKDQTAEIATAPHPTHDLHPFAEVVAAEARAPGSVPRTCRHVSLRSLCRSRSRRSP